MLSVHIPVAGGANIADFNGTANKYTFVIIYTKLQFYNFVYQR